MNPNPTKIALCSNDKCKRRKTCMRYLLKGDKDDTWIEFKSVKFNRTTICKHFIHADSEDAKQYIMQRYAKTKAGQYDAE
jgi:hypothetical protein